MKILVTGGAGYIGCHTVIELLAAGYEPVIADNFDNSNREVLNRLRTITGQDIPCVELDLNDRAALERLFDEYDFDGVIHFAGLKAVGESVAQPLRYYHTNVGSTLTLCETMQKYGVRTLVFSSSATVYGNPEELPLQEISPVGHDLTNPYGWSKFMIEQILTGLGASDPSWHITILRYFNPIGAHASGLIGEDPSGIPNNLLPYVAQVAVGRRDAIHVFGDDYDTADGTGVRDYIHVVDLARGHVAALQHPPADSPVEAYNLGTGKGTSVLELISAFEKACGKPLPRQIEPRRPGDIAACYADASKAERQLGWKAEKTIDDMCVDAWRWQSQNPDGYASKSE